MGVRRCGCLIALSLAPASTLAQPAPEPKTPPAAAAKGEREVEAVVVTAASPDADRVEIDRRSYSAAKTVQGQTGTLADLLRTIPSVGVDAQGNVSLRGDAAVQITIDGKPSGLFRGDGRAQAIQNLPSDQFERVEVITNPSAADSPEGSAGIINLVSRTARKAGTTGSARASLGTFGQYAAGASVSHNAAKLSLTGDVSVRGRDLQTFRIVDARRVTSPAGESRQVIDTAFHGEGRILTARAGADYDVDARTRLGVQARYSLVRGDQPGLERAETYDPLLGVSGWLRQIGSSPFRNTDAEASVSLRRKLGSEQELTADLRQERANNRFSRPDHTTWLPPTTPDVFTLYETAAVANTTGIKLDYRRGLANGGELKAGYELRADDNHYWSTVARGAAPDVLIPDPGLSGAFDYRAEIHGVFVTYQRRLGDLTALAGLRAESSRVTVTPAGERGAPTDRLRPYPSLHLSYPLSADRKLTGSYSRRVERPNPFLLSPAVSYRNSQVVVRGNPKLKPPETDSFELGYEDAANGRSDTVTLFYRRLYDPILWVTRPIDGGALLRTPENRGLALRTGVSVSANRKLTSKLTVSLSGDLYWTRVASMAVATGRRSAVTGAGRASLAWQVTADDLLQADVNAAGKTLTPQGQSTGFTFLNLGYRRKLTPKLFAVVTAQNVFDSTDLAEVVRTPTLIQRQSYSGLGPTAVVGLTYSFGAGPKAPAPPAFDFGGGGS